MRLRLILSWVALLLLVLPLVPAPIAAVLAQPQEQPAAGSSASPADIEAVVRVLRDDAARGELISRLQQPPEAAAQAASDNGLVGQVAEESRIAAQQALSLLGRSRDVAVAMIAVLQGAATIDVATVWGAIRDALAVIVASVVSYRILRYGAVRFGRRFDARMVGAGPVRRTMLLLAAHMTDAVSVVVAWGVGYAVAIGTSAINQVSVIQSLFLNAFLLIELGKVALRAILEPTQSNLRLIPLADDDARRLFTLTTRLDSLVGYGFLFAAPLVEYSGAWLAARSIQMLVMLAMTIVVIRTVLANRTRVRLLLTRRLRGGKQDTVARIAAYLGTIWHLLAIAYMVAVFVVWLTNPYSALPFMLRATAWSAVAVITGVVIAAAISNFLSHGIRGPEKLRDSLPLLEVRLNAFVPLVLRLVRLAVLVCVVLAIADIWDLVDIGGWMTTARGSAILGGLASLLVVLMIGGAIYLAMASWVEYRLNPNCGTVPTARERTLLVLFRNAFTITLMLFIVMTALSQIGVNIAPLLAGAGVVGLALGFGAQKLVQDVITGVFIQLDNAMNEGEVVTVAGISGLVERLTIRSVSLRDLNGVLHVIPFSAVDRVSNMMRHFSCHLVEIGVAYRESIPEVKAAILEAFDRLKETEHGAFILEPMEMYGLARFADSSLVVMARFKTTPGRHWNAGRAYNEILKEVFDARGIEIPFPHLTLYMGRNKDGSAPPLHVTREERLAAMTAAASRPRAEGKDQPVAGTADAASLGVA